MTTLAEAFAAYNDSVRRARRSYWLDPFAGSREVALEHISGEVIARRINLAESRAMRAEVRGWR